MTARRLGVVVALAAAACSPPDGSSDSAGTWVGTISSEGNVTIVANEDGSVWDGPATLIEEASIGVEAGADPYMFGHLAGVVAADQRIYVLDGQVPALRICDFDGRHVADIGGIGGIGSGPGEFREPDGPVGEPIPVPEFPFDRAQLEARSGRSMMAMDIPFYPDLHWTLAPTGRWWRAHPTTTASRFTNRPATSSAFPRAGTQRPPRRKPDREM